MTKKPTLTGDGKKPDGQNDNRKFEVVDGQGDLPAPLPPADAKKPAGIITPHGFATSRQSYKPPEPSQETLLKADHAEWLQSFAYHMSLDTGVPMTAFRQGAITRLWWAFRYMEFITKRNTSLQQRVNDLERETRIADDRLQHQQKQLGELEKALARFTHPSDEDRGFGQPHRGHHHPEDDADA